MERTLTDLIVLDDEETSVDGRSSRRLLCAHRQGIYSVTLEQWSVVADGLFFVLSGTCDTNDRERVGGVFAAIARSCKFADA